MSSVLVRGMEIPKCCYDCPFIRASVVGDFYCVTGDGIEEDLKKLYEHRMSDCPLIEVKTPHGRLIDADEIEIPCLETTADQKWMEIAIKSTPTVIEAEGNE